MLKPSMFSLEFLDEAQDVKAPDIQPLTLYDGKIDVGEADYGQLDFGFLITIHLFGNDETTLAYRREDELESYPCHSQGPRQYTLRVNADERVSLYLMDGHTTLAAARFHIDVHSNWHWLRPCEQHLTQLHMQVNCVPEQAFDTYFDIADITYQDTPASKSAHDAQIRQRNELTAGLIRRGFVFA